MLKTTQTPSLEIAYEENGSPAASAIILVHGFPDDVRTWEGVVPDLLQAGYRTLAPYLRGFGPTRFRQLSIPRSGQMAALGCDILEFADSLDLQRFVLVGHDWGADAALIAACLAPQRVQGLLLLATDYYSSDPHYPLSWEQARAYWYQWFFNMERGRTLLEQDRFGLCRWLWQAWSPNWQFADETYAQTASSFENPDFVEVAIHSYRYSSGNAAIDPHYASSEKRLAEVSSLPVPTTVLHGAQDGATLPEASAGREAFFAGPYARHVIPGVGHFIQRERPELVVEAVLQLARRAQKGR